MSFVEAHLHQNEDFNMGRECQNGSVAILNTAEGISGGEVSCRPTQEWSQSVSTFDSVRDERGSQISVEGTMFSSSCVRDSESTNLYVRNIPPTMTSEGFFDLFSEYGEIDSYKVICDPATGVSLGYGFINFKSHDDAVKAINARHMQPFGEYLLVVKFADRKSYSEEACEDPPNSNLYVKNLTHETSEEELKALFGTYGELLDVKVLIDKNTGLSRCIGMVKFAALEDAVRAKDALNGHGMGPRANSLVVKFAESEESRLQRREKRLLRMNQFNVPQNLHQMNGFYQPYGTTGFEQMGYPNFYRSYGSLPGVYSNSYQTVSGPSQMGNKMNSRYQPYSTNSSFMTPDSTHGPKHSLFVFHIPPSVDDAMIYQLFVPFGALISAKVIVDKTTGMCLLFAECFICFY